MSASDPPAFTPEHTEAPATLLDLITALPFQPRPATGGRVYDLEMPSGTITVDLPQRELAIAIFASPLPFDLISSPVRPLPGFQAVRQLAALSFRGTPPAIDDHLLAHQALLTHVLGAGAWIGGQGLHWPDPARTGGWSHCLAPMMLVMRGWPYALRDASPPKWDTPSPPLAHDEAGRVHASVWLAGHMGHHPIAASMSLLDAVPQEQRPMLQRLLLAASTPADIDYLSTWLQKHGQPADIDFLAHRLADWAQPGLLHLYRVTRGLPHDVRRALDEAIRIPLAEHFDASQVAVDDLPQALDVLVALSLSPHGRNVIIRMILQGGLQQTPAAISAWLEQLQPQAAATEIFAISQALQPTWRVTWFVHLLEHHGWPFATSALLALTASDEDWPLWEQPLASAIAPRAGDAPSAVLKRMYHHLAQDNVWTQQDHQRWLEILSRADPGNTESYLIQKISGDLPAEQAILFIRVLGRFGTPHAVSALKGHTGFFKSSDVSEAARAAIAAIRARAAPTGAVSLSADSSRQGGLSVPPES